MERPVDHETGAFGVEFGGGVREAGGAECVEESSVALLSEVVAALVHFVDGAFDCGDVVVGGVGGAGAVFSVPEVEVGAVLGYDGRVKGLAGCDDVESIIVPESGGAVVQAGDFDGGKVERRGH